MRSTVSLIRCASYDPGTVEAAVRAALELLDGLDDLLRGKHVLVKPNLLSSTHTPEFPVNTHPAVLRAFVRILLRDYGCRVVIGDSCGTVKPGATNRAMEKSGVTDIARDLGVEAVNFDTCPFETITREGPGILKRFNVAKPVLDADVVVSLPKFKTHQLTWLTGAVKNMLGVVPGRGKKVVHLEAPMPRDLAMAMVDIYEHAPAHLALMDAVVGMEGNGPNGGTARDVGLLLASRDGVALDTVAAALMGYRPGDVRTNIEADERGLGVGVLDRIDVRGEAIDDVAPRDFKKPFSYRGAFLFRLVPHAVARWGLSQLAGYRSVVDSAACVRCGQCIANCPSAALSMTDDHEVVCDADLCIACYCCEEVCDYSAIRVVRSAMARAVKAAKLVLQPSHWGRKKTTKGCDE